ncbi:hypothetical protein A3Q56_02112 [Intoshia linei]|uniref:Uncharacterized protein n=1 Tax=Intoshia linei TaxID=1819745 RepID=A0A177B7A9_9BILA|nr:hypothetical protein A3Q56_02112 [Intoshia linei]
MKQILKKYKIINIQLRPEFPIEGLYGSRNIIEKLKYRKYGIPNRAVLCKKRDKCKQDINVSKIHSIIYPNAPCSTPKSPHNQEMTMIKLNNKIDRIISNDKKTNVDKKIFFLKK